MQSGQDPGSLARVTAAVRPRGCSQPWPEKHPSKVWGSQENPSYQGSSLVTFSSSKQLFSGDTGEPALALCLLFPYPLTLKQTHATFPNLDSLNTSLRLAGER